jgi:hypothetical protein
VEVIWPAGPQWFDSIHPLISAAARFQVSIKCPDNEAPNVRTFFTVDLFSISPSTQASNRCPTPCRLDALERELRARRTQSESYPYVWGCDERDLIALWNERFLRTFKTLSKSAPLGLPKASLD